jgi:hypothetical protein
MRLPSDSVDRVTKQFADADLGDPRRRRRVKRVVEKLAKQPSVPLPAAMGSEAELEGAYRLMSNAHVSFEELFEMHALVTTKRACDAGEVLAIHDTTTCQFDQHDPAEVGYLPTGKAGFFLHLALVVDAQQWRRPLGIIHAETLSRRQRSGRGGRSRGNISGSITATWDDRESERWRRGIAATAERLADVETVIHVADREGDSYALLDQLIKGRQRFVFRVRHDRHARVPGATNGEWGRLRSIIESVDGVLEREVSLSTRKIKQVPSSAAHPARYARVARLTFSATTVQLSQPRYLQGSETLTLNVVRVSEPHPPDGEEPVEWLLYTTELIRNAKSVERIVDIYRTRWLIEEFNKALKSGCKYEERQLESRHALLVLLALTLPIACELLWLRSRARSTPDAKASDVIPSDQIKMLRVLAPKLPRAPTARDVLLAVAGVGGHQRSNGDPGWLVLHRGMSQLATFAAGWRAASNAKQRRKK